jgi:hypothetical protein
VSIHYYLLSFRIEALVASQLNPEEFGAYMAVGSQKLASGKVIFFEIDSSLKSDYFKFDEVRQACVPHPDGSPKRSKYVSVYRVMEHLPVESFGNLYLTTANGRVLELQPSKYDETNEEAGPNLYQELCPLPPMVASRLPPAKFIKWITDPTNRVGAPRLFMADLRQQRAQSGELDGSLPYGRPEHIQECIEALERHGGKESKTVARTGNTQGFYRTIRRGFFVGDQNEMKFFRYPGEQELEVKYSRWWKAAQLG